MSDPFSYSGKHSILTTSRLTKTFGKLVAVNQLDLEVRRGDVFGFLGPNGSGKTTTIRMLPSQVILPLQYRISMPYWCSQDIWPFSLALRAGSLYSVMLPNSLTADL